MDLITDNEEIMQLNDDEYDPEIDDMSKIEIKAMDTSGLKNNYATILNKPDLSYITNDITNKTNFKEKKENDYNAPLANEKLTLQSKIIVGNRVQYINDLVGFMQNSKANIVKIVKRISNIILEKIYKTLKSTNVMLEYFKYTSDNFTRFSKDFFKSIKIVSDNDKTLPNNELINVLEKNHENVLNNFSMMSQSLEINQITKTVTLKVKEYHQRLAHISNYISEKIVKSFELDIKNFIKFYEDNYLKILNSYEHNNDYIMNSHDFLIIDIDIVNNCNKMITNTNLMLQDFKKTLQNLKELLLDYTNLTKGAINNYNREVNRIFNSEKHISCESINNESIFTIKTFLNEENVVKELDSILVNFVKTCKRYEEIINPDSFMKEYYNDKKFSVKKFSSFNNFVENFIIATLPQQIEFSESLAAYKTIAKRCPGHLEPWKDCLLIFTVQENLFIFKDETCLDLLNCFDLKKARILEDKKNNVCFEITQENKGFLYNSSTSVFINAVDKTVYDNIMMFFTPKKIDISKK